MDSFCKMARGNFNEMHKKCVNPLLLGPSTEQQIFNMFMSYNFQF